MNAKRYTVVYADPPWDYFDVRRCRGGAVNHYPTMSLPEICALPVRRLTTTNAVLFLWSTSPYLMKANEVIKSWGFRYKAGFVWHKAAHNVGWYNSVRHEFLLLATKGSCRPKQLIKSVHCISRTRHSEKPEQFRVLIDTIYPQGHRIELFARRRVVGWDAWGDELS